MQIKKSTSDYLIKLIKAELNDYIPSEKPEDVLWKELFELANYHKVEELTFAAIGRLNKKPQGSSAKSWKDFHKKNQIINILQESEFEAIIDEITNNGISILPLKGSIIKPMYPRGEFRQMGDLDFLVEAGSINKLIKVMEELGYEADDVGLEASHDVYVKRPYLEVEMHRRLLPPTEENHWHTDGIWERLVQDVNNPHLYHMTWNDYYLYHLLHFEKHYSMGGSGIRYIIDQFVFMKAHERDLDREYLDKILEKMNYVEFEKMCHGLAEAWFGDGETTKELEGPAEFIVNSGIFGTFEQYQQWALEKYKKEMGTSKIGFFFNRMFMERERMEFIYPSLKKHRWLLPFLWVHRLFKAVTGNHNRIKAEMQEFKKLK